MGLQVANGEVDPELSHVPLGTPAELKALGFDLAKVRSCAVPIINNGVPVLLGCYLAEKCAKVFGRPGKRFGGFGPPSLEPGTPGKGREYVPFRVDFGGGQKKEDFTWCYAFVGSSLYEWLVRQNNPDYTGPKVRLMGKAGEGGSTGEGADIVIVEALPEDPNNNRTRNYKIAQTTKVVTVAHAPRLSEVEAAIRSRRSEEQLDEDEMLDSMGGVSAAAGLEPVEVVGNAKASEGQKKRRGRPPKQEVGDEG